MALGNINFEVSDPGFYDSLISDQKKILAKKPKDAMLWVELGRLHDAKSQMTSLFAQKRLIIKWFPICTYILILFSLYIYFNNLRLYASEYCNGFFVKNIIVLLKTTEISMDFIV